MGVFFSAFIKLLTTQERKVEIYGMMHHRVPMNGRWDYFAPIRETYDLSLLELDPDEMARCIGVRHPEVLECEMELRPVGSAELLRDPSVGMIGGRVRLAGGLANRGVQSRSIIQYNGYGAVGPGPVRSLVVARSLPMDFVDSPFVNYEAVLDTGPVAEVVLEAREARA